MADTKGPPTPKAGEQAVVTAIDENDRGLRWWQGIPPYAWLVLFIAALGWLFDAMDQNLFNLVRQPSIVDLLNNQNPPPANVADVAKQVGGEVTAIFLVGWAVGGFVFGMLGDRLGRTRTMIITILIYAIFTGLSGITQTIEQYKIARFLTALGVGGEFAAGAALVAEVWPARSRPMALGALQALSAFGNMMAAGITYALASYSWRYVYFVGALPALLVIWIRLAVKEPEKWVQARDAAQEGGEKKELGNVVGLFTDPVLRRNTIAGTLIAMAGVGGLWGVGFFLTDLNRIVFKAFVTDLPAQAAQTQINQWVSMVFLVQQIGAFFGMFAYAALSERTGRKPALAFFLVLAFLAVEGTFLLLNSLASAYMWAFLLGFCALAPFAAFAVYFPELYPTRLRATGVGFCYNCARLLAASAPFVLGGLALHFRSATDETAGLRTAASIVACIYAVGLIGLAFAPETKGKPLPE